MTEEQLTALYGQAASYSDYKRGERIKFREGVIREGTILWVCANPSGGVLYIVDTGQGWPSVVQQGQIVV